MWASSGFSVDFRIRATSCRDLMQGKMQASAYGRKLLLRAKVLQETKKHFIIPSRPARWGPSLDQLDQPLSQHGSIGTRLQSPTSGPIFRRLYQRKGKLFSAGRPCGVLRGFSIDSLPSIWVSGGPLRPPLQHLAPRLAAAESSVQQANRRPSGGCEGPDASTLRCKNDIPSTGTALYRIY